MFALHIRSHQDPRFPLCGSSAFERDDMTDNENATDCWECASIAGVSEEQLDRNNRTDLCVQCRPLEHQTCSLEDIHCSCCQTTLDAMEEGF